MSSTRENRETKHADLESSIIKQSDAMSSSLTTEQPKEQQDYQANTVEITPEKALLNSNVTTPPPRPDHIGGRSDKPMVWDEDYLESQYSICRNHKSPCPRSRRKGRNERTEPAEETAPEKYAGLPRAPLPIEKNATAEDSAWGSNSPLLSSSSEIQYNHQNSRSTERSSANPDGKTIKARTETLSEANPSLSKQTLPLDWTSNEPNLSSPSGVNDNQYYSGTVREWCAAPNRQSEIWKGVFKGETPYQPKLPFPLAKGRNTNDEGVEAPQGTALGEQDPLSSQHQPSSEDAENSVKRVQIAEISSSVANDFSPSPIGISGPRIPEDSAENPALSSSSLPIPALAPQDDSSQALPRSRFVDVHIAGDYAEEDSRAFRYFSNEITPVKRRIVRAQSQTVPQPPRKRKYAAMEYKDDDGDDNGDVDGDDDSDDDGGDGDDGDDYGDDDGEGDGANEYATAHGEQPGPSQQKHLPSPSPDSRIQMIPTKNPSRQYYSHHVFGGWRVLDSRNASYEIEKEKREKAWRARKRDEEKVRNEAEEVRGGEYRKPLPQQFSDSSFKSTTKLASYAAKRQQSGYPYISRRASGRAWKSWENKKLLRSHAAGLSFAQISASAEFSQGLVIRTEDECRERYDTLQEWQSFQDEELLRAGESAENEDFAVLCANKFSKGLVKRSEQQCRERYEFLKKSEFEAFEWIERKAELTASLEDEKK